MGSACPPCRRHEAERAPPAAWAGLAIGAAVSWPIGLGDMDPRSIDTVAGATEGRAAAFSPPAVPLAAQPFNVGRNVCRSGLIRLSVPAGFESAFPAPEGTPPDRR
jgi:hypothetical protein